MSLEAQRPAPPGPNCVEPGCDRTASVGDERCDLHQVRLGRRPSSPSSRREVIVEAALDAPQACAALAPVSPALFWRGVWGWLGGSGAFWGSLLVALEVNLGTWRPQFLAFLVASGGASTAFAAFSYSKAPTTAKRLLAALLLLLAGGPAAIATVLFVVYLAA